MSQHKAKKAEYMAAWRLKNKEKIKAWRAKNKERHSAYRAANKDKIAARKAFLQVINREKISAASRAFRVKNIEKVRARDSAYYFKHKEKRNKKAAEYRKTKKGKACHANSRHKRRLRISHTNTVTSDELLALKQKSKSCYYCGIKTKSLTLDHIIPLCKGGAHSLDNLIMACAPCNSRKCAKDPHIFARQVGLLLI